MEQTTTPTTAFMLPPPPSPDTSRRKSLNTTIRERVGRLLTKAQPGRRSQSSEPPNLQNFTFADSKLGSMVLAQMEQEQASQVCHVSVQLVLLCF